MGAPLTNRPRGVEFGDTFIILTNGFKRTGVEFAAATFTTRSSNE